MRRLNLFVISFALAMPAAAEIYQWRDAQGRLHYSDTPPPGQNTTRIPPAPRPPTKVVPGGNAAAPAPDASQPAESAKPKTLAERELEFRQRRAAASEADAKAEQERQQQAERQRDCERARAQLGALESGQRMSRYGADGERIVLEDAERADEIGRTRKLIDSTCK